MTLARSAPELIRRAYHRALAALPLRANPSEVPDPAGLTALGAAEIDGRTLVFATQAVRPRMWLVAEDDTGASTIGYLTGLVLGTPDLWVTDPGTWDWINTGETAAQIKHAATRIWHDCERTCDG
ncbi:hypothetical protein [Glycomyces arizonensis]|uniref:hypothetical protein n=1 Tax=Glycomyces arizonensis TaxID=256035 RepID=UPI00040217CF|nr:hypothetical protein [Glycomyces arizonensis]